MNRVKEIERINQRELDMGGNGTSGSWHDEYRGNVAQLLVLFARHMLTRELPSLLDSAYIYVGGLPDGITEGDLITICSQYVQPCYVATLC